MNRKNKNILRRKDVDKKINEKRKQRKKQENER